MRQLDKLYNDKIDWLDYQEIDKIVQYYKDGIDTSINRNKLLRAYHKYFMKYVAILKGVTSALGGKDTVLFLALFNTPATTRGRTLKAANRLMHRKLVRTCNHLEPEEVYNELVSIFLALLEKFSFKPGVSFAHYITQYMRWDIKAWLLRVIQEPATYAIHDPTVYCGQLDIAEPITAQRLIDLPELNLAWVAKPDQPIFSVLTSYERFLLYLRYKEGLSLKQIGDKLGRTKDTINSHLDEILTKLRTLYQGGTEI